MCYFQGSPTILADNVCVCECDLAIIGTYVLQFICESIGKKLYILSYEKKRIIFFLIKLLSESFEIFVLFFFVLIR